MNVFPRGESPKPKLYVKLCTTEKLAGFQCVKVNKYSKDIDDILDPLLAKEKLWTVGGEDFCVGLLPYAEIEFRLI